MEVTWKRRWWHWSAVAGLGAACWLGSVASGAAQSTDTQDKPPDASRTTTSQENTTQDSQSRQNTERDRQSSQAQNQNRERDDDDDTQGVGRSQSGTDANRPGTSEYNRSTQSRSNSGQSGFGSTQTGRSRSDAQSGSEYNYGASPSGRSGSRDASRQSRDTARSGYDNTRDAIGEARDDMRGAARGQRDQFQDTRQARDDDEHDLRSGSGRRSQEYGRDDSREDDERYARDRDDNDRRDAWQDDRRSQSASREERSRSNEGRDSSRTQVSRSADVGIWFNRGTTNGLVIADLASSGPITRFGFREGDRIVSVNGTRIGTEQQFVQYLLSPQSMNQRVQVIVWRNNQQVAIWVEPWALMQENTVAQNDPLETYGIILDDRYSNAVVWRVTPRSPAYYAGVRSGDVIVAWSGQYVYNPDDLTTLVQQHRGDQISVQVSRNRQLRQLTLDANDGQSARTALRPSYDSAEYDSADSSRGQAFDQEHATRVQTGTYGQAGYGQAGYGQTGVYGQAGGYVQPTGTYGQQPTTGTQQNREGGILPRLRGR